VRAKVSKAVRQQRHFTEAIANE